MLIQNAEIKGQFPIDLRIEDERIGAIGPSLDRLGGEPCLDAAGGALLPGLHDHHVHLLSTAAAATSLCCGPPEVNDEQALARALGAACRACPSRGWVRGVGYCESVAGDLDRKRLDALTGDVPVRVQHRSGALWIVNSAAASQLGLCDARDLAGVETDERGEPNGRLFRLDGWLRERLPEAALPDLGALGQQLARYGTTGVTDATAGNDKASAELFLLATANGALPQSIRLMGSLSLPELPETRVVRAEVKILLDETTLPDFDRLRDTLIRAHAQQRGAAIHCVTRAELVFAIEAFAVAGVRQGDRIEHAAVADPEHVARLRDLGLCVVTQPNFIAERGEAYATDVDPIDLPWLYRGQGFVQEGVPLGGGTDAPFGNPDPWLAMRAAVDRKSATGRILGPGEALSPERALALFTTPPEAPGGRPRTLQPGSRADLCLLDRPWSDARKRLSSEAVRAAFCAGRLAFCRD